MHLFVNKVLLTTTQQYIEQILPFDDQMVGAAILQIITRLAIPLGIGITSAIWSSRFPTPKNAVTNLNVDPVTALQLPYLHVFIATLCFAIVAIIVAPFARLGKLGVTSTATDHSLPQMDTVLKTLDLDGGGDREYLAPEKDKTGPQMTALTRYKVQPRNSSLLGTRFNNLRRTSTGGHSFGLPRIIGFRASGDTSGLGLAIGISDDEDDTNSQRTSTAAMTERVIWLVCEDCGASKRIVEPVGDPERHFYDSNEEDEIGVNKVVEEMVMMTPPTPSSKYSSVYNELEASVADVGFVMGRRRFALVNRPDPRLGSFAEEDEN